MEGGGVSFQHTTFANDVYFHGATSTNTTLFDYAIFHHAPDLAQMSFQYKPVSIVGIQVEYDKNTSADKYRFFKIISR